LEYQIITDTKITKALHYEVESAQGITKSLKYTTIITPAKIELALVYGVETTPSAITKSLRYASIPTIDITKSLKYCVITDTSITQSLKYWVRGTYPYEKMDSPYTPFPR